MYSSDVLVKLKNKRLSTMQADLSFNSTFPGWLFDYPHGKGNEICLTSSTDHANKQWPSAIERKKKVFYIRAKCNCV